MKRMKKRMLSLLLALAMTLSFVPTAFADEEPDVLSESGFVEQSDSDRSDGFLGGLTLAETLGDVAAYTSDDVQESLPADDSAQASDEVTLSTGELTEGTGELTEEGLEESGERASDTGAANEPEAGEQVTFVVVLEQNSLLDEGYSTDEIAAGDSSARAYEDEQKAALEELKDKILDVVDEGSPVEFGYTYTVASTGLSVTTTYENKAKIAQIPEVERVYVAPMFHIPETDDQLNPQTSNATTMIGADKLNTTGYTGKGMRIAILDTGLEYNNPSFGALSADQLTEDSMTRDEVISVWNEGVLNASESSVVPGNVYRSTKVPFAFNYDSHNLDVSHNTAGSDHGTHVAGIAAANVLESTEVVGVAPEAQLLVMQVFSGNGADWAVVMAALEDCVYLDVDVANLSLGAAAGYTDNDSNMMAVLEKLMNAGVQVVIAAGNDTNNTYNNNLGGVSKAGNPDVGLVGTPSTYDAALSVASANNDKVTQLYFTVDDRDIGYGDNGNGNDLFGRYQGKDLDFVVLSGYGDEASYAGVDVEGKVVVVSRGGGVSFPDKQTMAEEKGAIACVVYNNTAGTINMQINTGASHIPCVSITQADGLYLAELGSGTLTVTLDGAKEFKTATSMSDFSSWGSTPNLKLKPEITGVGGNIYSTRGYDYDRSGYGYMSGTSMASPQVAGAMAVLNQYLEEQGYEKNTATWELATNLLMSTADPIEYSAGLEYSPRQQGAGLVDLVGATEAGAYLSSGAAYGRPKAEVGESADGTYSFTFQITNISDEEKSYRFDSSLMTETIDNGMIANRPYALEAEVEVSGVSGAATALKYDFNDDGVITTADARLLLRSLYFDTVIPEDDLRYEFRDVNGDGDVTMDDVTVMIRYCAERAVDVDMLATFKTGVVDGGDTVTVPAGETVSFTATITLTANDKAYMKNFPNGEYVEGFLYVRSADGDTAEDLSMPILGFYGDWSKAPVFDSAGNDYSLYPRVVYTYVSQLGTNPYIRASQRSGDEYNAISYVNPLAEFDFGLLRNAKLLRYTVTDVKTGAVYFQIDDDYVTKSYYSDNYGQVVPYYLYNPDGEEYVWQGADADGNPLDDGTRIKYTVEAFLDDGDDVLDDSWYFEATLDTTAPEISNADSLAEPEYLIVDQESGKITLTLELYDNQNIAAILFVDRDRNIMGKFEPGTDYVAGQAYEQTFNITGYGADFTIVVADYACNETELEVSLGGNVSVKDPQVQKLDPNRLYGSENINYADVESGWFSVNKTDLTDARNETFSTTTYNSGEYVNGYVVAQRSDGDLVLLSPYGTYWGSRVLKESAADAIGTAGYITLYDMALQYNADGPDHLYAVGWTYDGNNTNNKYGGTNYLYEIEFDEYGNIYIRDKAEFTGLNGAEMVCLAIDNDGTFYGISTTGTLYTLTIDFDSRIVSCTKIREIEEFTGLAGFSGLNIIQSMCFDHEDEVLYWAAHSNGTNGLLSEVLKIDPETGAAEFAGETGYSGASALFIPTEKESDLFKMGVDPTDFSVSPSETYMLEGTNTYLDAIWSPWNAKAGEITWKSSDESVATVNASGYVTAVGEGTATITAETKVWNQWHWDTENNTTVPMWETRTQPCTVTVVPSQEHMYGYIISDDINASNKGKWVTYADTSPRNVTQLGAPMVEVDGEKQNALWQGGTYCNGYLYTVQYETRTVGSSLYEGTAVYCSEVNGSEIGDPKFMAITYGIEVGNIAFDYNTGRMYGIDLTNGGLCVIDVDTGSIDTLGAFANVSGYEAVMTAMCIICEDDDTTILAASMMGNLYTIDPDTLECTQVGSAGAEYWYYGAMLYDYNTKNIYWNPSGGAGNHPLYLVIYEVSEWDEVSATPYDIGDVASSGGVEQTVMFTIPEAGKEPETKFIPVESMEIDGDDIRTGLVGGTIKLTTSTEPIRPTVQAKTWESSDETVATVDSFGNVTCLREGETTITVTLTDRNGTPFTDSVTVNVLESGGELTALLASDSATGYWDFWLTVPDYAPEQSTVGERVANFYNIRAGEYYDGYFYGYDHNGTFIRVSASDPEDFTTLGSWDLGMMGDKVVDMAFDYTTGTMYALTVSAPYFYDYNYGYYGEARYGTLMKVNLTNGKLTPVAVVNELVNTLAVDKNGTLYAVGTPSGATDTATIYTVDKETAACESIGTVNAVVRGYQYAYLTSNYNPQMTYDYALNRLYLKAADSNNYKDDGLFMIQLDETGKVDSVASLGKIALYINGSSTVGDAYLGLLCMIPSEDDLPEGDYVTGVSLNNHAARMLVGDTMTLRATVSPSNADPEVTWMSSDTSVAEVNEDGVVTAVSAGTAVITAASVQDDSVTDSCTVTVVADAGDTLAYAITDEEGLITFNPELPNNYTVIGEIDTRAGSVVGMDVDDATGNVYYVLQSGSSVTLYRYNIASGMPAILGELFTYGSTCYDMVYDADEQVLYLACDLYVYQYYVPSLSLAEPNRPSKYIRPVEVGMAEQGYVAGVTLVDGKIHALCTHADGIHVYQIDFNTDECYFVGWVDGLDISAGSTEFTYDADSEKYYVTNARDELYTFTSDILYRWFDDATGEEATLIGTVGGGLTITGLTIAARPTEELLLTWSMLAEDLWSEDEGLLDEDAGLWGDEEDVETGDLETDSKDEEPVIDEPTIGEDNQTPETGDQDTEEDVQEPETPVTGDEDTGSDSEETGNDDQIPENDGEGSEGGDASENG